MIKNKNLDGMILNGTQMKHKNYNINDSKRTIPSLTSNNNLFYNILAHNPTMFIKSRKKLTLNKARELPLNKLQLVILRLNYQHKLFDVTFCPCLTKSLEQKRQDRAQQFTTN